MSTLVFRQNYTVTFSHIDNRGFARPSAIADFMQDAATVHANEAGLSRDELVDSTGAIWLLSRLKYYLKRPLFPYETVTVATWHRGVKGALWYRDFEFFVGDELVGSAVTAWAIVNIETRRLLRPSSVFDAGLYVDPARTEGEVLGKLHPENIAPFSTHRVAYSDLDINNHLNNVKVVDIVSDALEVNTISGAFVSTLQVNYLAESPYNTKLELLRGRCPDNGAYVSAQTDDQTKFEACVYFTEYRP